MPKARRHRPNRPRFLRSIARVAGAFAIAASACTRSPGVSSAIPSPSLPESKRPRELNRDEQVSHALSRLTYGARDADIAAVKQMGLDRWIKRQLTPENWPDRSADSALAHVDVLLMSVRALNDSSPPRNIYIQQRRRELGLPDNAPYVFDARDSARFAAMSIAGTRRANHFLAAKVMRAVVADQQLLEVMTDFWENHFSVFRNKMPSRFSLLEYDRDVIRPHALGNFRQLLGAVAHSGAMLFYLDNQLSTADTSHLTLAAWQNLAKARTAADSTRIRANARRRRGGLNENYGRELMELHTLGVDGGYSQGDVINVARALTGWAVKPPLEGSGFQFNAASHDADEKLVLGHVLPAGRGEEDGEQVLDILAAHPSTARYIATKLVRHFVSDTPPPALVARAAAEFSRSGGDIRRTLALIVSSPEFYARKAVGAKVKTPYQLVVSTYRALGAVPDTSPRATSLINQLGQGLFARETPDGWPDDGASWLNTGAMMARINLAVGAGNGRLAGAIPKPPEAVAQKLTDPAFQRR